MFQFKGFSYIAVPKLINKLEYSGLKIPIFGKDAELYGILGKYWFKEKFRKIMFDILFLVDHDCCLYGSARITNKFS